MSVRRRLMQLFLIIGLVPSIMAAGLPIHGRSCLAAFAIETAACSGDVGHSCCGETLCHCHAKAADDAPSCCHAPRPGDSAVGSDGEERDSEPVFTTCRCGRADSPPAVPGTPPVELPSPSDTAVSVASVLPPPQVVTASIQQVLAARIPSVDVPTMLCTLLI